MRWQNRNRKRSESLARAVDHADDVANTGP
jgi:hypothetical protein